MRKKWGIAGLMLALVLAVCGFAACNDTDKTSQEKPNLPQSVLLSGFESDKELLTMIFSNMHAKVEISDEHVTDGKHSAKMTVYGKLSDDKTYYKDNDFYIVPGNAFLSKMDYSDVVGYSIDIFNASNKPLNFVFGYNHLLMSADTYTIGRRVLQPGENHLTFEIDNNVVKTFTDVTAIKDFAFYVEGRDIDDEPTVLYLDNFRAEVLPHESKGGAANEKIDFSVPEDSSKFAMFGGFTSLTTAPVFERNSDLRYVLTGKNSMKVTFNAKKGGEGVDCPGFRTCDDMFKIPDTYDLTKTYLHFDMYNDTDEEITVRVALFSHIATDYFASTVAIQPRSWAASGNRILLGAVDDAFVGNGLGNLMSVAFEVIGLKTAGSVVYLDNLTLTDELGTPATPTPRLAAPSVSAEGKTVKWNAVENAIGYSVQVNDGEWSAPQTETSYTLNRSTAGNYTVRVKALGDGVRYRDSDATGITVLITEKLATPEVSAEHNSVSWNAVANAAEYKVKVDDGEWSKPQTELSYKLEGVSAGEHTVKVVALSDNELYTQSDEATLSVTVVAQLATPVLSLDGKTVSWQAVAGARGYSVQVGDGNPAEQTQTSYTLTATDGGEYVIKVIAISANDGVENSFAAQVKITVIEQLGSPSLSVENVTVSWNAVNNADGYKVKIDDGEWSAVQTETTYTLDKDPDVYTVYVKAVADEEYYLDSEEAHISVTVTDISAPKFTYSELNKVSKNKTVTLGEKGIANYLTVTDFSGFDLEYRVVKYGARGAEELAADTKNFTVLGGEYYEVYVTATDKSEAKNTSRACLVFAAADIADRLETLADSEAVPLGGAGEIDLKVNGSDLIRGFKFDANTFKVERDSFSNASLKMKSVANNAFELMFHRVNCYARFTVRLETELNGLSGNLFAIGGVTITANDIGEKFVVNVQLTDRGDGLSTNLVTAYTAIQGKDVWVVIDNIEIFTPNAPIVTAENETVKKDSGANITFTAAEFGVSGEDYLGNELKELKVTEVKFNDTVKAEYTDGYALNNAPDGTYKITFTATDRYGMQTTKTVTVIVGELPPEITVTNIDNYVASGTAVALGENGIANYLSVQGNGGGNVSVSYRVMKNGSEEIANAQSITVGAGEYYEIFVTATESNATSRSYILFAESSLSGVLKTLNGNIETVNNEYIRYNGAVALKVVNGNISGMVSSNGNTEICLSGVKSGLQLFFPYATSVGLTVSFTVRVEGTFAEEGDLISMDNAFNVTAADAGKNIAVTYSSSSWFPPEAFGIDGLYSTLDSITVSELFLSDANAKIYIDNIVIKAA